MGERFRSVSSPSVTKRPYKPAGVTPVVPSVVLTGDAGPGQPFSVAREPLQGFKKAGASDADAFLVVANHLKSKSADASPLNPGDAEDTSSPGGRPGRGQRDAGAGGGRATSA